jgi:hypothetical protein
MTSVRTRPAVLLLVVALTGGLSVSVPGWCQAAADHDPEGNSEGGHISESGATHSGDSLDLATTLTLTGVSYLHSGRPHARADARLLLEPVWTLGTWGEMSGAIVAGLDNDGEIARDASPDWRETSLRAHATEVRELQLTAHLPAADLTFGKQVIRWGIGDALQPTDSLTPRDLTDPLLDRRLGAWGASADFFFGGTEAVVSLLQHAPDRLPLADRRWFPVGDLGAAALTRRLPSGSDAWIGALQVRGYARYFDWSLVVRRGPDLAPHVASITPALITLDYPRMSLIGGWVSVPVGGLVLRSELAWRRYDRQSGQATAEDFATLLAGVEHRFAGLVWDKDVTWITELVDEEHTSGSRLPRAIAILDPVRLFRTGLYSKLLLHNPTGWEAELGGGADLAKGGGISQLLVRYNASDRLEFELGLDVLFADGNRALGPIAGNDRLMLRTVFRP